MPSPRRIVAVAGPREAAAVVDVGKHRLVYHGGHLLASVEVFTIFWGAEWHAGAQAPLIEKLNEFFDKFLVSSMMDVLAEFSVPGQTIGKGQRIGTLTIADSE